jgi:hypothetical protein
VAAEALQEIFERIKHYFDFKAYSVQFYHLLCAELQIVRSEYCFPSISPDCRDEFQHCMVFAPEKILFMKVHCFIRSIYEGFHAFKEFGTVPTAYYIIYQSKEHEILTEKFKS